MPYGMSDDVRTGMLLIKSESVAGERGEKVMASYVVKGN